MKSDIFPSEDDGEINALRSLALAIGILRNPEARKKLTPAERERLVANIHSGAQSLALIYQAQSFKTGKEKQRRKRK